MTAYDTRSKERRVMGQMQGGIARNVDKGRKKVIRIK
jgi:hypothetical protein